MAPSEYRFCNIETPISDAHKEYRAFRDENPFGSWPDYVKQKAEAAFNADAALEALNAMTTEKVEEAVVKNAAVKAANIEKRKREEERSKSRKAGKQLARMAVEKPKPQKAKRQEKKAKLLDEENQLEDDLGSGFDKLEVDELAEIAGVDELRSGLHKLKVEKAKRTRGRK